MWPTRRSSTTPWNSPSTPSTRPTTWASSPTARSPSLQGLDDPNTLKTLIRFCTQMEGMAVHAAHATREAHGALGGDEDYAVYTDESVALHVIDRYREVLDLIDDRHPVDGPTIGQVLGAMSSGERLWHRFGALVAHEIEQTAGRDALVATVTDPDAFDQAAAQLLRVRDPSR